MDIPIYRVSFACGQRCCDLHVRPRAFTERRRHTSDEHALLLTIRTPTISSRFAFTVESHRKVVRIEEGEEREDTDNRRRDSFIRKIITARHVTGEISTEGTCQDTQSFISS